MSQSDLVGAFFHSVYAVTPKVLRMRRPMTGREGSRRIGHAPERLPSQLCGALIHHADGLASFLRNPARTGICFGVASARAPAAGSVGRKGSALSFSHDVLLPSVVTSWVIEGSSGGGGPTGGGGRLSRRVAGSGNVTDMAPSLNWMAGPRPLRERSR
jgi:hypothetical protein